MSHFRFKAKKATGETYTAERDAADRYELYKLVRETGDEMISAEEKKPMKLGALISFGKGTRGIKTIDKINFARNLGAMLEAGLALSRALTVLERQSKKAGFKKVLTDVIAEINKGNTFTDALKRHDKIFPELFISMVHAGEQSGTLAQSLKAIGIQMDSSYALERRIRGAMMYPAVIVAAMIIIAILMFIFVIPTLMATFIELKVELPASTQFILTLSNIIQHQGLWVILGVIVLAIIFSWWKKTVSGKKTIHATLLKIPVIGALVQEVNAARTARTLSSLITSGVDVVESISITSAVVQNVHFRAVLDKAKEAIKKGDVMSKTFGESTNLYPVFFSEMMSVGEETGKMGEMLLGVAHYYENDVEQKTKDMSTIIEPFLMIVIGAAVGFFAISMISPMYSLVNAI
ncbi:MAG: type II secretion system F family protein [Patescibacteria group bacterium]